MDSFDGMFARKLVAKIAAEAERRTSLLLDGKARDLAEYRGQVEFLKALVYVRELMGGVQKELSSPEPPRRVA